MALAPAALADDGMPAQSDPAAAALAMVDDALAGTRHARPGGRDRRRPADGAPRRVQAPSTDPAPAAAPETVPAAAAEPNQAMEPHPSPPPPPDTASGTIAARGGGRPGADIGRAMRFAAAADVAAELELPRRSINRWPTQYQPAAGSCAGSECPVAGCACPGAGRAGLELGLDVELWRLEAADTAACDPGQRSADELELELERGIATRRSPLPRNKEPAIRHAVSACRYAISAAQCQCDDSDRQSRRQRAGDADERRLRSRRRRGFGRRSGWPFRRPPRLPAASSVPARGTGHAGRRDGRGEARQARCRARSKSSPLRTTRGARHPPRSPSSRRPPTGPHGPSCRSGSSPQTPKHTAAARSTVGPPGTRHTPRRAPVIPVGSPAVPAPRAAPTAVAPGSPCCSCRSCLRSSTVRAGRFGTSRRRWAGRTARGRSGLADLALLQQSSGPPIGPVTQ